MLCLKVSSDSEWAAVARRDLNAILIDHAHCEMKAAANALSLASRPTGDFTLIFALTDLAREEIDHFQRVAGFLEKRGLTLGAPPVDHYANDLRKAASALPRDRENAALTDRLLVAALIEARSCERFKLLLPILEAGGDAELFVFYKELFAAEARHYQVLVDLAIGSAAGDEAWTLARLERLAEREAEIVTRLSSSTLRSSIHG